MDAHTLDCLDFPRIRELLAGYAFTGLGKALAASIKPIARMDLIRRWLAQVLELQKLEEERGLPPFAGVSDVREIIERCGPPLRVSVEEIARVGDALSGTHAIATWLRDLPEAMPEMRHLAERVGDFATIAARIGAIIDARGQVRDDASPKLARIRGEIEQAGTQIRESVERILRDPGVRRFLQYPNHTFHNDRIVVPLKTEYRGRVPGIIHRHSDSGATIYVEPAACVELNNVITNLRIEEQEEINRLLWDLAHEVHLNAEGILKTLDALAVLDLIVAKVRFARDLELRCPDVNDDGVLDVRGARHPLLLDMQRRRKAAGEPTEHIVPIDYRLGRDFLLLIITGPNTGGKTVTLKTVGVINLMLQSGLPVPVGPGSSVGLFSTILIDIGDEQSMAQSLSTFSAHLNRLMEMLRKAGPRTLLLIDELGAGTDPDEGAAIGRAMLDELVRLDTRCMVTTHFGALKGFALMNPRAENASVEFDVRTLRPTYHLVIGESGGSNAIEIAQRLGMPRRLILAARRNLSRKARALKAALEGTSEVKRQAEAARNAAVETQLAAQAAQGEAAAAREQFEKKQADFQQWVQRVVHLQPGDAVRVRGFDRDGKVVRLRLDLHRAEVDVGAFAVEVPLGDILPPQTPAPPPRTERPRDFPSSAPPRPRPPRHSGDGRALAGAPHAPHPGHAQQPPSGQHGESLQRSAAKSQSPRPAADRRPPRPAAPPLSDGEIAALKPGDLVFAKPFQRDGRVVRVQTDRKLAVVSVGALEVELPFSGLGRAAAK